MAVAAIEAAAVSLSSREMEIDRMVIHLVRYRPEDPIGCPRILWLRPRLPSLQRRLAVSASDKLFYWVFQNNPDWILELQADLPADARGYRFSAPVLKEREHL